MAEPTILRYVGWETDVRVILGIDENDLTDAQLASRPLLGDAELYVKSVVTGWQDLTGDDKTLLELATLYMIAHYVKESSSFNMPSTIKDGENYISWGHRTKSESNEQKNIYFNKAWEKLEKLVGVSAKAIGGTAAPEYDIITGE